MKSRTACIAAAIVLVVGVMVAGAGAQKSAGSRVTAEKGLVGINLYDSADRVLQVYGSPNEIQSLNVGGGAVGPVGGAGGARGAAPVGGAGGGGGGRGGAAAAIDQVSGVPPTPYGFADEILRQARPIAGTDGGGGGVAPAGGRPGASGSTPPSTVAFTRWVYNRPGSKYSFIVDKDFRVVQVEAIGVSDPKVRTVRGLSFGATFSQIIKSYGHPDGYDVSGDGLVVRYLQRNKIAFRLSRLGQSKQHVVTGVVIAGGKA